MAVARLFLSVCVGVIALGMLMPSPANAQVTINHVRVTVSGTSGTGAGVTAVYCDSGTPCTGGIQVWSGFPVPLATGASLVLTQTASLGAPNPSWGNFDTSDRIRSSAL